MKILNQDKKIVSLDGTRIETLWSTVEKGTNENGDEYEKKQAVAPRTFEKAIMDDSGTLLSKKIEDILSRISQIGGGIRCSAKRNRRYKIRDCWIRFGEMELYCAGREESFF